MAVDLTNRESCARGIEKTHSHYGSIDIMCNIAGGFLMGESVHETSDKTWDFLFNLNTRSILNTSAAAVPHMLQAGSGKIINMGAGAANKGVATMGAYVAYKNAVMRLTETMALELRESNINVNSVLPSVMDTPKNRSDMPSADFSKWVQPSSVAEVVGFLASDSAKDIHGVGIPVSGLN
ncbi:MAG: SDR family oxidoreductase [Pseudomonadales bacterium]|nr:SDR family oxidoreductase [Pseudomonadales bacterium]